MKGWLHADADNYLNVTKTIICGILSFRWHPTIRLPCYLWSHSRTKDSDCMLSRNYPHEVRILSWIPGEPLCVMVMHRTILPLMNVSLKHLYRFDPKSPKTTPDGTTTRAMDDKQSFAARCSRLACLELCMETNLTNWILNTLDHSW